MNKIPKIIHQIWIQGEKHIPQHLVKFQIKIKKLHPNWTYILWNEIMILELLHKLNDKYIKLYYQFNYMHQKIDFAKLIILYNYGGIAIDMDAYTIKNLNPLFDKLQSYDFVVSKLLMINSKLGKLYNYVACRNTVYCLNNGNIISKPKSDILKYLINNITSNCSDINNIKILCINNTTGPLFFQSLIHKYLNDSSIKNKSKIKILSADVMEPCLGKNNCKITSNTFIVHEHEQTWFNDSFKTLFNIYLKNDILCNVILVITILAIIYKIKTMRKK